MRTQASCTWGDGPDVLIRVPDSAPWGIVQNLHDVSFGLSAHDTKMLVNDLLAVIATCEELEAKAKELTR